MVLMLILIRQPRFTDCLLYTSTLDFILDSVADTGLHVHSLARFLLRLLLLLLLAGVLRVGLTFLRRRSQILCSLVGLAIVVHRHLRAALVGRGYRLRVVGVRVVAVRGIIIFYTGGLYPAYLMMILEKLILMYFTASDCFGQEKTLY